MHFRAILHERPCLACKRDVVVSVVYKSENPIDPEITVRKYGPGLRLHVVFCLCHRCMFACGPMPDVFDLEQLHTKSWEGPDVFVRHHLFGLEFLSHKGLTCVSKHIVPFATMPLGVEDIAGLLLPYQNLSPSGPKSISLITAYTWKWRGFQKLSWKYLNETMTAVMDKSTFVGN